MENETNGDGQMTLVFEKNDIFYALSGTTIIDNMVIAPENFNIFQKNKTTNDVNCKGTPDLNSPMEEIIGYWINAGEVAAEVYYPFSFDTILKEGVKKKSGMAYGIWTDVVYVWADYNHHYVGWGFGAVFTFSYAWENIEATVIIQQMTNTQGETVTQYHFQKTQGNIPADSRIYTIGSGEDQEVVGMSINMEECANEPKKYYNMTKLSNGSYFWWWDDEPFIYDPDEQNGLSDKKHCEIVNNGELGVDYGIIYKDDIIYPDDYTSEPSSG